MSLLPLLVFAPNQLGPGSSHLILSTLTVVAGMQLPMPVEERGVARACGDEDERNAPVPTLPL